MSGVVVYYSYVSEKNDLLPPVNILKKHFSADTQTAWMRNQDMQLPFRCPAMRDFYKNVFGVPSLWDYTVKLKDGKIFSEERNDEFFKNAIQVRSHELRGLSLKLSNLVLLPEPDSLMFTQYPPFLEDTLQHGNYFPGSFDVGIYPRTIDLALRFLSDTDWVIKREDILYYIKFHTKEKIVFKPFVFTDKLDRLFSEAPLRKGPPFITRVRGAFKALGYQPPDKPATSTEWINNFKKPQPMKWYYDLFAKSTIKQDMLKEARANLL